MNLEQTQNRSRIPVLARRSSRRWRALPTWMLLRHLRRLCAHCNWAPILA
jgi:hypothetical protein